MLPNYGEERNRAFRRLQKEIKETPDSGTVLSDEEQQRLLVDALRYNQINTQYMTIKKAHAETCKWLLHHPTYTS
jgi:hypothetical protein